MEKKYLFLLVLVFLAAFSSCSEEENWEREESLRISKVYRGENLEMTLSDTVPFSNGRVLILANEDGTASVSLYNVMPVEDTIVFPNIRLENFGNRNSNYTFLANTANEDRTIKIQGEIIGSKLKINVAPTVSGELIGKWTAYRGFASAITMEITPSKAKAMLDMHGILGYDKILVKKSKNGEMDFDTVIQSLGLMFGFMNPEVTFQDNGLMSFGLNSNFLPSGPMYYSGTLIRYTYINNDLHLSVSLDQVAAILTGDIISAILGSNIEISEEMIKELFAIAKNINSGTSVSQFITKIEGNKGEEELQIYIPKEVMLPIFEAAIPILLPMMDNVDWDAINNDKTVSGLGLELNLGAKEMKGLLSEIVRVMGESPKFDLVIKLKSLK